MNSTPAKIKEEPESTSDEVVLVYDSWDGKDEKPDLQELKKMNQSVSAVQMRKDNCLLQKQGGEKRLDNLGKRKKRTTESETFSSKKCMQNISISFCHDFFMLAWLVWFGFYLQTV